MAAEDRTAIQTVPMTEDAVGTVDVRDASAQGLALMEERVKNQKKMLAIAIGLTAPNQWTVFAGNDKSGNYRESVYPTGGAADTILRRAFGLTWSEKELTVEDTPDGKLATCSAWLMRGDERIEQFTGYRFMGGYIKNEADLRKGAIENMKSVAVRDLLGMRFRTPAELKEMGLDIGKLERRAEMASHDDAAPGTAAVPWGKLKGTAVTELKPDQLDYYEKKAKEAIADPEKAKWKGREQKWLDAVLAEKARRANPPPPASAEKKADSAKAQAKPTNGEFDYGPPPMSDADLNEVEKSRGM